MPVQIRFPPFHLDAWALGQFEEGRTRADEGWAIAQLMGPRRRANGQRSSSDTEKASTRSTS